MQIYGQMDEASMICEHLLLGSTFNASNRRELDTRNVSHILNVTREVDNFFPGENFIYKNVREFDLEDTQLLPYWEDTHRFINLAKENGTRCLVHCKMGVSRSAATVIAYLMKEYQWDRERAHQFVKAKRACINPNDGFWKQLGTYNGILEARNVFQKEIVGSETVILRTSVNLEIKNHSIPVTRDIPAPGFDDSTVSDNLDCSNAKHPGEYSIDMSLDGARCKQLRL
ncbi:Protein phosphatase Slingshot 2 [Cichlidogyrus casuarinus]|uniref:protein-serine/threonine phosphatase n=1 Tax=Cichlidogyrus casuarinus TaxID=1844966 RepID=A0ABD2QB32_9PLAT